MIVADVSAWQTGLRLGDLGDDIEGIIAKLTQNVDEELTGPDWIRQIRSSDRWKVRGWYHFLGPGNIDQQIDTFAFALGDLEANETIWLDWEANAFTGYTPPQEDAYQWLLRAEKRWPGATTDGIPRVGWYSYRSMAIRARQSGDFDLPLWLSDPNVDGPYWAATLKATLLQWGQPTIAPIGGTLHNLDCSDVIDAATLIAMGGDMTPTEIQQFLDSPCGLLLSDDGHTMTGTDGTPGGPQYTVRQTLQYSHEEGKLVRLGLQAAIAAVNNAAAGLTGALAALQAHDAGGAGFGGGPFKFTLTGDGHAEPA